MAVVGYPLTPEIVKQLGGFTSFPDIPLGFAPDGNWTNTYKVWTCHGYTDRDNDVEGSITIQRTAGTPFTLDIHQEINDDRGITMSIDLQATCANDSLASPSQWSLSRRFIENGSDLVPECGIDENVTVNGTVLDVDRGGNLFQRPGSAQLTADWCIFEAVQRLGFQSDPPLDFDWIEGLSGELKKDQSLFYYGTDTLNIGGSDMTLYCFRQLGKGVLPYEYWLDENHRLLLAISGDRAYILTSANTPGTPPAPETHLETFGDDPTAGDWTNQSSGSTTFTYNSAGYLDASIYRQAANRSLYIRSLSGTYDKTMEFWWEMDVELLSTSGNFQRSYLGVFDSGSADNEHNSVIDRFAYWYYVGGSAFRGNRNDIYGYASDGTKLSGNGSPTSPGIPYGTPVRVKGHYWYESATDQGKVVLSVYNINPDGTAGGLIMTTGTTTVIGNGKSLSFDKFGLGNRTDGTSTDSNDMKVDNLYFSNQSENTSPVLPSFY